MTLRIEIMQLQNCIEELALVFPGAIEAVFMDPSLDARSYFSKERLAPTHRAATNASLWNLVPDTWSLNTLFEGLKSLEVVGSLSSDAVTLPSSSISFLPQSLVNLNIQGARFADITILPPNLESLTLHNAAPSIEQFYALPRSLTLLNTDLNSVTGRLLARENDLLPNLISQPIKGLVPSSWQAEDSEPDDPPYHWSNSVTHLHLVSPHATQGPSDFVSLPPHVQVIVAKELSIDWIRVLPPTVTQLMVDSLDWKSIGSCDIWPPSLTRMSLVEPYFPKSSHLLPRGLKFLSWEGRLSASLDFGEDDRETALLNGLSVLRGADASLWQAQKLALLHHGSKVGERGTEFVASYIHAIESGALYGLPLGLETLYFTGWSDFSSFPLLSPPMVRTLSIRGHSDKNFTTGLLPPFLQDLQVDDGKSRSFIWHTSPQASIGTQFHLLGHLTRLELDIKNSRPQEAASLPILPLSLRDLVLTTSGELQHFDFAALPDALESLTLTAQQVYPTKSWMTALPRSLKRFKWLGNLALDGSNLALGCPPQLECFHGRLENLTLTSLMGLPRTLSKFEVTPTDRFMRKQNLAAMYATERSETRSRDPYADIIPTQGWKILTKAYAPFWRVLRASEEEILSVLYQ